jgi:hypothetical protein
MWCNLWSSWFHVHCRDPQGHAHGRPCLTNAMAKWFAPHPDCPALAAIPHLSCAHSYDNNLKTNIHSHTATCHKPPSEFHGCRLCKPTGLGA